MQQNASVEGTGNTEQQVDEYLHEAAAAFIFRNTKQEALQILLLQGIVHTCKQIAACQVASEQQVAITITAALLSGYTQQTAKQADDIDQR